MKSVPQYKLERSVLYLVVPVPQVQQKYNSMPSIELSLASCTGGRVFRRREEIHCRLEQGGVEKYFPL